ncbi:hypothetical protein [Roseateles oligotrophus]|uniref:Uncharacterized protein n=1 Tax=Roseateles oligotrophus TaxID=1769250 RepID=A0ABT2YIE2_9BURK|nr:hypothetical protein [Roseateles oligotrophus]MCV2369827.1 hypothetical protein [Roseateles oligotrophus]
MTKNSPLYFWLCGHRIVCFLMLTISFVSFGALSLDLIRLLSANAGFLFANGWAGLVDGGLRQLIELSASALAAMACYVLFKLCEHALVHRLAHAQFEARR